MAGANRISTTQSPSSTRLKQAGYKPNFRQSPPVPAPQPLSPAETLRQLLGHADILGRDPEGSVWLLLSADERLFDILTTFEAGAEDAEEGDFTIVQDPQQVQDDDEDDGTAEDAGDFEPDYRDLIPAE
jgi:hypothetical protein